MLNFRKNHDIQNLKNHIEYKQKIAKEYLNYTIIPELSEIESRIKKNEFKGIIVYSEAVLWEPIQRPQQFLFQFAQRGYLCFFCEVNMTENYNVKKITNNLYVINGQEKLLPLLKDQKIIFYITYFLQYVYASNFNNTILWVDILDRLDFFSGYNSYSKKIWKELIRKADILTYSAKKLKQFIPMQKTAYLLPNAANIEDFIINISDKNIPSDLEPIIKKNKKIIGYYGAIEHWFDFEMIKRINDCNKYSIVLIGRASEKILKDYKMENVYFLGPKKFDELKYYIAQFDIAIIPFVVNKLTNCVSPVKFFEYLAAGKTIISTPIYELKQYNSPILKLVHPKDYHELEQIIDELLRTDKEIILSETKKMINQNTWLDRTNIIEEKILEVISNGLQ